MKNNTINKILIWKDINRQVKMIREDMILSRHSKMKSLITPLDCKK
jgi:hypothetical protein